jgi:seryl-tRNA(Sec) selenium transferase
MTAAAASLPPAAATLTPMINATGVLVHTDLGRAPLSAARVRPCGLQQAARTWGSI